MVNIWNKSKELLLGWDERIAVEKLVVFTWIYLFLTCVVTLTNFITFLFQVKSNDKNHGQECKNECNNYDNKNV